MPARDETLRRCIVAHVTDPASGSEVTICGLNISRWQDGLLAEEWAVWESLPSAG